MATGEWLMVGGVWAYAGLLLAGPLVALVAGAFGDGLGRLWRELTHPDAVAALQLTLALGLAATAVNTVCGLVVALVLVRDRFPGRSLLNGLVDLPFAVSPVVAGLMLILLFGRNGWLTPLSDWLGLKLVFSLSGMLLATIFVSLPFVVRELMPVLNQVGIQPEQAAYTMGATPWQAFWAVTFPAIRWGLFYGVSLTLARTLGEFGAVLVVSGGVSGMTETSTLYIFRSLDDRNYVGAYVTALVLAGISFVILTLVEYVRRRQG
jgi:sulfate transport system permease protein